MARVMVSSATVALPLVEWPAKEVPDGAVIEPEIVILFEPPAPCRIFPDVLVVSNTQSCRTDLLKEPVQVAPSMVNLFNVQSL